MKVLILVMSLSWVVDSGPIDLPTPIEVPNGAPWGSWGTLVHCPPESRAFGFSLKIERSALDLTAVNGLKLICSDPFGNEQVIESDSERWGEWGAPLSCSSGYLTAFRLRVQRPLVQEDETAVNDVQFECSSGQVLAGNGLLNGEWGPWSGHCPAGICSFESRIQEYQGVFSDDTALNNLLFYCC